MEVQVLETLVKLLQGEDEEDELPEQVSILVKLHRDTINVTLYRGPIGVNLR